MTEVLVTELEPGSPDAGAVAHYGDPVREQRTLATAAGLVDRSHRGVLAVSGPDRLTWLHDLTTQHLTTLAPGEGTELLVLSPHGHVEHHAVVTDDGTTTWLDTEPDRTGPLLDFLTRMRFLTRVEPADVTADWALLSLVGPLAEVPGVHLAPPAVVPAGRPNPRGMPAGRRSERPATYPPGKVAGSPSFAPVPALLHGRLSRV